MRAERPLQPTVMWGGKHWGKSPVQAALWVKCKGKLSGELVVRLREGGECRDRQGREKRGMIKGIYLTAFNG